MKRKISLRNVEKNKIYGIIPSELGSLHFLKKIGFAKNIIEFTPTLN